MRAYLWLIGGFLKTLIGLLMVWGKKPIQPGSQNPPNGQVPHDNPPSDKCDGDITTNLFRLIRINQSHAVIVGPSGAGKTRFLLNALPHIDPNYTVFVLDVTGGYEGYTDYHAPYPLNVVTELSPVILPSVLAEVFEIAGEEGAITPTMARNLELLISWLLGIEEPPQGLDVSKYPKNLSGLIKLAEDAANMGVIQGNLVESVMALIRRLNLVRHWMVDSETHPLIHEAIEGKLRGRSIGIDLSVFEDDVQRWFYIISFLRVLAKRARNVVVIIDEAHLFLRREASTLAQFIRMGRNYDRYAVMVSQSPLDFPSWIPSVAKIIIEFPIPYLSIKDALSEYPSYKYTLGDREPGVRPSTGKLPEHWAEPHKAKVHIYVTTKEAFECYGPGLTIDYVKVDVSVPPRPYSITLSKCAELYGVPVGLIRERGFDVASKLHGEGVRGVWKCIGGQ